MLLVALHDVQHVLMRVPDVICHGQRQFPRQFHLRLADRHLRFAWRQVIVVIQPDFANGDDFLFLRPVRQALQIILHEAFRLVRMDADGGIAARMCRCEIRAVPGGRHVRANHGVPGDARFRHAGQDVLPVVVELRLIDMAMRVKQRHHPMIAPSSTPSPTLIRRRLSSSSTAERIMP